MKQSILAPLALILITAACAPLPATGPAPGPAPAPAPLPAPDAGPVTPDAAAAAAPDNAAMSAACQSAATQRLGGSVFVGQAEQTALGFVVFGQSQGNGSVECSFGPDGSLRAVRTS